MDEEGRLRGMSEGRCRYRSRDKMEGSRGGSRTFQTKGGGGGGRGRCEMYEIAKPSWREVRPD